MSGALVAAGNLGDGVTQMAINGVSFDSIGFNSLGTTNIVSGVFELTSGGTGMFSVDGDFGSAASPYNSLSSEYQSLLDSGVFAFEPGNTPASITLEMSELLIGRTYEFQWWVNDSRGSGDFDRTTTASAGNSVALDHNVANSEGGVGQYVIGTFTADATTQQSNG